MLNIMSLSTYKSINPSDFDKDCNPTGNFQRASTGLKSFGGRQIQQYATKTIKCVWDKKLWLLNYHIVDAEGSILIGLGTMLRLRHDPVSSPSSYLLHRHKCNLTQPGQTR